MFKSPILTPDLFFYVQTALILLSVLSYRCPTSGVTIPLSHSRCYHSAVIRPVLPDRCTTSGVITPLPYVPCYQTAVPLPVLSHRCHTSCVTRSLFYFRCYQTTVPLPVLADRCPTSCSTSCKGSAPQSPFKSTLWSNRLGDWSNLHVLLSLRLMREAKIKRSIFSESHGVGVWDGLEGRCDVRALCESVWKRA